MEDDNIPTMQLFNDDQFGGSDHHPSPLDGLDNGVGSRPQQRAPRQPPQQQQRRIERAPPQQPQRQAPRVRPPPAVEEVVEEFAEEQNTINDAQTRMAMASYYNALLGDPLFGDDDSYEAQAVEHEIRSFAKERLEIFLGMRQEKVLQQAPVSNFSPDEEKMLAWLLDPMRFKALSLLLNKLMPQAQQNEQEEEAPPVVQRAAPKAPPRVQPKPQPTVRRSIPAPAAPTPRVGRQASAPPPRALPAPARRAAPSRGRPQPNRTRSAIDNLEIYERNEEPPLETPYRTAENPNKVYKDVIANGERIQRDITPEVKPVGMKPMPIPSPEAWNAMNAAQLSQTMALSPNSKMFGTALPQIGAVTQDPNDNEV